RRRHTRLQGDWSSDVCSSDLSRPVAADDINGVLSFAGIATGPNGDVYVTWLDVEAAHVSIDRSTNGGESFGIDRTAATFTALSRSEERRVGKEGRPRWAADRA